MATMPLKLIKRPAVAHAFFISKFVTFINHLRTTFYIQSNLSRTLNKQQRVESQAKANPPSDPASLRSYLDQTVNLSQQKKG